jgi:hypothetical protein
MRFSLAYNEDGSILTTPLGDEDAPRLARTGDTSDLFDITYHLRDVELNESWRACRTKWRRGSSSRGNTRQEADDGQF